MVVPYEHTADLVALAPDAAQEIFTMTRAATDVLRRTMRPTGFNIGMNLGHVAGGHRRPPSHARRPALGRRHQLHVRRRRDATHPAVARRDLAVVEGDVGRRLAIIRREHPIRAGQRLRAGPGAGCHLPRF